MDLNNVMTLNLGRRQRPNSDTTHPIVNVTAGHFTITLLKSITLSCGTDNITQIIPENIVSPMDIVIDLNNVMT